MPGTETIPHWNAAAGEWQSLTVAIAPEPRRRTRGRRTRGRRPGTPCDLSGLLAGSPLPEWWRDTAFAPSDGFADMRTFIKPAMIQTHRAPVMAFAPDAAPATSAHRRDL